MIVKNIKIGRYIVFQQNEKTLSGIILLIVYLFFAVRLSPDLMSNSNIWKFTFLIYILAFVIYLIKNGIKKNMLFFKWYIPFIIFSLWSVFWAYSKETAIESINILLVIVITFGLLSLSVRNYDDIYALMKTIMCSIFTCFIDLIMNLQWGALFSGRLGYQNINSNWNSNAIGTTLVTFIIFSIILYNQKKLFNYVIIFIIDCVFGFFAFLTGSRKTILLFVICISIYYIEENRKKMLYRIILFAICIIGGYYIIMKIPSLYNIIGYRFEGILTRTSTEGSLIGREKMIDLGIQWFWKQPFIGHGIDNYRAMSPWKTYAHNNYVEILVDIGIIGFILYYRWIFVFLKNIFFSKKYSLKNYIIAIFISMLVIDYSQVSYNEILPILLIFFGLLIIDIKNKGKNKDYEKIYYKNFDKFK